MTHVLYSIYGGKKSPIMEGTKALLNYKAVRLSARKEYQNHTFKIEPKTNIYSK